MRPLTNRMLIRGGLALGFALLFGLTVQTAVADTSADASAVGFWQTIDDETKKPKSHVEIAESGGKVTGTIRHLLNPSRPNPTCDECPGNKKGKPILGMQIMWGLTKKAGESKWEGGKIMDPKSGKVYDCKIWLKDANTLQVRGSWLMFGRTQTWHRIDKDGNRL